MPHFQGIPGIPFRRQEGRAQGPNRHYGDIWSSLGSDALRLQDVVPSVCPLAYRPSPASE